MTTIVNTPSPQGESNGSVGMLLGLVGILLIGYLFFAYGLPAMQSTRVGTPEINIPTQVVVPDKVDVNVNNN